MQRCFQLAAMGLGYTAPNPIVGALLVFEDRIIGEGFHQEFGGPHAEVNCMQSVPLDLLHLVEKSTLYVSLEPCAHFGKTPPCSDLIISKKIPEVVIGCGDINEQVNGRGIEKLERAGVRVRVGILEKEALIVNRRFFTFQRLKRPYIILKWARSSDNKMAGADKRIFISNALTNRLTHKWRSEEGAILVGTHTAINDDPALTSRLWKGPNPLRTVIDRELKLPQTLQLFDGKVKTMVFNQVKQEDTGSVSYIKINDSTDLPHQVLASLYNEGINSVIIEGGATLFNSFIEPGLWDEARVITNELLIIGNGIGAPAFNMTNPEREEYLYTDRISYYFNESH